MKDIEWMRQTKRKRRVLDLLVDSYPTGIALSNELCYRYWMTEATPGGLGKADRRKSFLRTVLSGSIGLEVNYLADKQYLYGHFTAGIFARWAMWELLERKYLSGIPKPEEMIFAVGKDACAAFSVFSGGSLAVIGPATLMKDVVVLGNRQLDVADFYKLSEIPWKIMSFTAGGITNDPHVLVSKLARLPYHIEISEKNSVSTARMRSSYR